MVDAVVIGTGAGGAAGRAPRQGGPVGRRAGGGSRLRPDEHVADEVAANIYWMEERLSGGADPTAFGSNNSGMGWADRRCIGAPSAPGPIPATCNSAR
jgi:hypothetical protein